MTAQFARAHRRVRVRISSKLSSAIDAARTSWWVLPGGCLASSIALSFAVAQVDDALKPKASAWYLFKGGAEAAREVLSTVASSMMTFTGVVFSVTVLVLQLASTQFSPRVLRTFLKDRLSQLALGTFVGSFVYALLGLRRVRGEGNTIEGNVPSFTVWLSVMLAIASVAAFVAFIHHVAQSIRAVVVVRRIGDETRASLDRIYPESIGDEVDESVPELAQPVTLEVPYRGHPGVLAEVAAEELADAARQARVVIKVVPMLGDFVPNGSPLFQVRGPVSALDLEVATSALRIRAERDAREDTAFGIRELVDVAERALSPGVNDPSTAVLVLDELHDILRRLARRRFPSPVRRASGGELVAILPRHDFDDLVRLALDEIRHDGASSIQVMRRLRALVLDVMSAAPSHRRGELAVQLHLLEAAVQRGIPDARDRATALAET